ncbi:UDP-N-acetylglucosamine 1-carboxyvinyltransferase [Candidatus Babeliales bacterium]|nr:UDP-N-acetylglucosamine 1-carboxyvinyltransferase [Candidatus Babeliales bacterium]MCF7899350.1 UDP-N-acetylglucosamine 1-carboxyvinyltransferase [Candidatus Babeliales bacterium]
MSTEYIIVEKSKKLNGKINLSGSKNATLPIMAALILTSGKSELYNVPESADILQTISLLKDLGAQVDFDPEKKILIADTSTINNFEVKPEVMNKMRASILVMGPLLSRFKKAKVALPGGCLIGKRPIDLHLNNFKKMGVNIEENSDYLYAQVNNLDKNLQNKKQQKIILEYPSVGATENIAMLAASLPKDTFIINAALEPEVLDFLDVLKKMGVKIEILPPATIKISGVKEFKTIKHKIIPDRLEAGSLLSAVAFSGGQIELPDARADHMDIFLEKLSEMGHEVIINPDNSIKFKACKKPKAVSFKTGPYPCFPTDLQAPMMVLQTLADGESIIEETVFENRLLHVQELKKMGADITHINNSKVLVKGVKKMHAKEVLAGDIRACTALVIAGLACDQNTIIKGISHWRRGHDKLEEKFEKLGAKIKISL